MAKKIVQVPYNFTPRPYQMATYNCLDQGYKRGVIVWHRRAGKDKTFFSIIAREAFKRVGTYYYILPYYKQGRRIIWEGIDGQGFRFLHHIPEVLVKRKDNISMKLELANGSFIEVLGSDNIDAIVGANPVGIIFSEFSLHKVAAWDYLRPILVENGGWALFNGTPRGKNHLYTMLKHAEKDEKWFHEVLTVEDTGVVSPEQIDDERSAGMLEARVQQEFYCSFEAALAGAYYGDLMASGLPGTATCNRAVPWEPDHPVHTAWDLGRNDHNVIWFYQAIGSEIRIIDCLADRLQGLAYYVKRLKEKPYVYGNHYLPHDVKVVELTSNKSRLKTLQDLGLSNIITVPKIGVTDGIEAVRSILPKCFFDKDNCATGIEAMKAYRSDIDEKNDVMRLTPVHDWASHYADAFRYLAVGYTKDSRRTTLPLQSIASGVEYDPLRRSGVTVSDEEFYNHMMSGGGSSISRSMWEKYGVRYDPYAGVRKMEQEALK